MRTLKAVFLVLFILAMLLLTACASTNPYWGKGDQLVWVRPGTGEWEAAADAEVCKVYLVDRELFAVSVDPYAMTASWYLNRFMEWNGRREYRQCMMDMGYSITSIDDPGLTAVVPVDLSQ